MSNSSERVKRILPTLRSPRELMGFSQGELLELAAEIREEIYMLYDHRSVHFASNLGVVELCIALHSTFDFSVDRLVWDTGHQIYPHKLLTGRFERFQSIRTKGGLMGFPNPAESEYDLMMTGHAGCSVGTVLGLASGDDLMYGKNERHSIAVIGDGAVSSGVVFEAMNHAGWIKKNITVILNDNKMSICPRVGGLSTHLDKLRMQPFYQRLKQRLHSLVDKVPTFGKTVDSFFARFKSAVKAGLLGGMLFEELGFRYIGPINGHNIPRLQRFLKMARNIDDPVLLHVFTEKGHGFKPAENNPSAYHAPAPGNSNKVSAVCGATLSDRNQNVQDAWVREESDAESISDNISKRFVETQCIVSDAKSITNNITFTEVVRDELLRLMREDERICVITAAMCRGNMLEPIRDEFRERFFDVGICESHAVVFAAGLARSGMIPVVDIYSTFIQRSYDQIFQEVSLQNLPIVMLLDRAGLTGPDGPTHHGVFDIGFLRPFPNLLLTVPADASDVGLMLRFAVTAGQPVAMRYPKARSGGYRDNVAQIQKGKSEIIREGNDGKIVVCGAFLDAATGAANFLYEKSGVSVGVINARFIKPIDETTILQPLREGLFVVTIEEGMLAAGFGSAILELANDLSIDTRKLKRLGFPDQYIEHGERNELLDDFGLNQKNLIQTCQNLINK